MRIGNLPGIRRLPLYLNILRQIRASGARVASASAIASEAGLVASVVRKDLEMTGAAGTTGIGYLVDALIADIESFLGWNNPHDAFLIGVGNLGGTILGCAEFRKQGLNIVAAFDNDSAKTGTKIHGIEILPVVKLAPLARRLHIGVGILTVPDSEAQKITDVLVASGITRIWSFASAALSVPPFVTVQREDLAAGLAELLVRSAAQGRV